LKKNASYLVFYRADGVFFKLALPAFALRIVVALAFPNIIARDEIFQYLEQAHRLVFGQGFVPWEYQIGLRNWLIPLLLAVPMELAHWLWADPVAGLILIRVLLCAGSLSIVWAAASWGEDFYGRKGAWTAGLVAALFPDLLLFAPHALEEVFAADCLVPALYLASRAGGAGQKGRIAGAAFLLGLTIVFREQLVPAVVVAGVALCGRDARRWLVALAAGAVPICAAGMLDWYSWGEPFRSFWLNVLINGNLRVSETLGASPPGFYVVILLLDWLWAFPLILVLCWRGARKLPVPALVILAILIPHALVAHKEYRFIFPAIAIAIPLAGVGLAGTLGSLPRRRAALAAAVLAGPLCSPWLYFWLNFETSSFAAFERLAASHPALVATGPWLNDFLPLDILFDSKTKLADLGSLAGAVPADIAAIATEPNIPAGYTRFACYKPVWIPLSGHAGQPLCLWSGPPGSATAPTAQIPIFPEAAKGFIVQDWIGPGEGK
jgi:hypothetical protein